MTDSKRLLLGRYLQMARRHKLTHLYATTTAFRLLKDEDPLELKIMKLPNLRVIGTLGEPVDEETYTWLRDVIGKGNCSVVTGWMQTQSGVLLCSGLPGVTPAKPATCGVPMPGVDLCLVDDNGNELTESPAEGKLLVKQPWPAMARGFFGNNARFEERYLKPFPGRYYTGDLGKRDEDGQYRVEGSVEDIINSGGYRVSCSELEAALSGLGVFNDTAVVGIPHNRIGQAICAFVVPGVSESEDEKPMTRKRAEEVASQAIKSVSTLTFPGRKITRKGLPAGLTNACGLCVWIRYSAAAWKIRGPGRRLHSASVAESAVRRGAAQHADEAGTGRAGRHW